MDKQTFIAQAAALQPGYQPNDAVRERMAQVELFAVVGPTGVGKSTIAKFSGLPHVLSDMTRPPRQGETSGIDYNYRTDYEQLMQELQTGEFVQFVVERNNEFYGTKAASYPATGSCVMHVLATEIPRFRSLGFKYVQPVFIVPPSYEEWMRRIGEHHDKDLDSRLIEAKESLDTALKDQGFVFLLNDDLAAATQHFKDIAAGRADQTLSMHARSSAVSLLSHLSKVFR
jgi:guanylate kinase